MLKTIKILIITFIISLLFFNYVYAMDINMNLSTNTDNTSSTVANNTSTDYLSSTFNDDYSVSLSSMPEFELGLGNILNIILIVIGILLILLGIAIMIRLK